MRPSDKIIAAVVSICGAFMGVIPEKCWHRERRKFQ
jgi:hypothetical protein